MSRILITIFALVMATGCDSAVPIPQSEPEQSPPYRPVANLIQTMEWILDPAADVIWDSAGFIITAAGETDLQPTTDEGWEQVRISAAIVAEAGNLLMMPGRSGGPDWVVYAQQLREAGSASMVAAEAHDAKALFDAGGKLYLACRSCHEQYMVPMQEARNAQ